MISSSGGLAHIELVEVVYKELGEPMETKTPHGAWSVMLRGPKAKWCVIRPNGTIFMEGLFTRDAAQAVVNQQTAGRARGAEIHF